MRFTMKMYKPENVGEPPLVNMLEYIIEEEKLEDLLWEPCGNSWARHAYDIRAYGTRHGTGGGLPLQIIMTL